MRPRGRARHPEYLDQTWQRRSVLRGRSGEHPLAKTSAMSDPRTPVAQARCSERRRRGGHRRHDRRADVMLPVRPALVIAYRPYAPRRGRRARKICAPSPWSRLRGRPRLGATFARAVAPRIALEFRGQRHELRPGGRKRATSGSRDTDRMRAIVSSSRAARTAGSARRPSMGASMPPQGTDRALPAVRAAREGRDRMAAHAVRDRGTTCRALLPRAGSSCRSPRNPGDARRDRASERRPPSRGRPVDEDQARGREIFRRSTARTGA